MENKLSKLKEYQKVTLTNEERSLMRAHAARIIMSSPIEVTQSFFKRGWQQGFRIALSTMLFLIFVGGSFSALARNALPNNRAGYWFKINVNEKVKGLIIGTNPATQVAFQTGQVVTRLNEIQTLANSNSLTPATQETAAKAITNQVADLSANITTLSNQSPTTALAVTASLEQTLKANKAALENTPATTNDQVNGKAAAIDTVNTTLQTVSNQEIQILSKEIDAIGTATINTSTTVSTDLGSTQTTSTPPLNVTPLAP